LTYNQTLRSLTDDSASYLADSVVLSAAADVGRGINRGTTGSKGLVGGTYEGDRMTRGTKFTPPPMLTLSTKYDGIPSIAVYTGYAVQVVNKSGARRVVVGPDTILLEYDETLEVIEMSMGKPKTTDRLKRDVYLRVDNNLVSDIVRVETKDLVEVDLKLSYRVNFDRDYKDKWFSVENYVKYLCDHMRSHLKASVKKEGVKEIIEGAAAIVRDVVLGKKVGDEARHHFFEENGMDVYDVEVLGVTIADNRIAELLRSTQTRAVETAISLASEEQNLVNTRRKTTIETEIAELNTKVSLKKQELAGEITKAQVEARMVELEAEVAESVARLNASVEEQKQLEAVASSELARVTASSDHELSVEGKRVEFFEKKMAAVRDGFIEAMQTMGDKEVMTRLTAALAPLALAEQTSIGGAMERVFKGTPMESILTNITGRQSKAATAGRD
jgi:major vault protein